ncbi:MAG: hypothetical protein ACYDEQ_13670 [Desulfocucumaceae bacterium]
MIKESTTIVKDIPNLITLSLLSILYILSTLFGLIIDAIRHSIFKIMYIITKRVRCEEDIYNNDKDIYKLIKNADQLQLYNKIDEDYWYYYEAYFNIALALIPGIIIIHYFANNLILFILYLFLYLIIIVIMIFIAVVTLKEVKGIQENFLLNLKRGDRKWDSRGC